MRNQSIFSSFLLGLFLLIGVFGLLPRAQALQVGDIQVPEQVSVDSYLLTLHGAGMYKRFFFDRYVAALYTTTKGLDTATIVNSSEPRSLRLTLARKASGTTVAGGLIDALESSSTEQQLHELQNPMQQFTSLVSTVDEGLPGDTIALDFSARHVTLRFNGRKLGAVESRSFTEALLRVWLGQQPVQASLKKALLGQR